MALTDYTTCADIRAVLGVSDAELEDETLGLEVYSSNLSKELRSVHAQVLPQYSEVKALDEASRSDAQQQFYEAVRLFAVYAVARQLGSSLPLFGPKDVSDSKASMSRFSDSPYKTTMNEVKTQYATMKQDLGTAIAAILTSNTSRKRRVFMAVSGLSTDPVVA